MITELTVAGKSVVGGATPPPELTYKKTHGRAPAPKRPGKAEAPPAPAPPAAVDYSHDSDGATVSLGATQGWLPLPAQVDRYNPKGLTARQAIRRR